MADFQAIFRATTTTYNRRGIFVGVASIGAWADVFRNMHARLIADGATDDEQRAFLEAMLDGIDAASDSSEERIALRNVALTAFDGVSRDYVTTVAPKAQFLGHVKFST